MLLQATSYKLQAPHRPAFTLMEAMVALAIFGAFTSLMIVSFPVTLRIIGSGNQMTVAANLMQAKVEQLRSVAYADLGIGTYESNVRADADPASPYYNFTHTVTADYMDDSLNVAASDTGLKRVTLTTTWFDPLRGTQSKSVYTMVTAY